MSEDYKEAVLNGYEKKKKSEVFAPNLLNPTPGSLRNECLIVYRERYSPKDDEILRLFFNETDKEKGYLKSIENSKAEKFKQLPKILKREISNPGDRYIELIAWLIDFNPRPSSLYYKTSNRNSFSESSSAKSNEGEILETNILEGESTEETLPNPPSTGTPVSWRKIVKVSFFLILIITLVLSAYFYIKNVEEISQSTADTNQTQLVLFTKDDERKLPKNSAEQCMYWSGDHYVVINCSKEIGNMAKFVLDTQKVAQFRMITNPDTLTQNSVGKVYYYKAINGLECYTSEGFHPIYTNRKLKKLTKYMLDKYILNKHIVP